MNIARKTYNILQVNLLKIVGGDRLIVSIYTRKSDITYLIHLYLKLLTKLTISQQLIQLFLLLKKNYRYILIFQTRCN